MSDFSPMLNHLVRARRIDGADAARLTEESQKSGRPVESAALELLGPVGSLLDAIASMARVPELGEVLVGRGLLSTAEMERARNEASVEKVDLTDHLARTGLVSAADLADALADLHGVSRVDLAGITLDRELFGRFDPGLLQRLEALPLKLDGETLVVAVGDPGDVAVRDELTDHLAGLGARSLRLVVAPGAHVRRLIHNALEEMIAPGTLGLARSKPTAGAGDSTKAEGTEAAEQQGPELAAGAVVELLDGLMSRAIRRGASDIHLEPYGPFLKVKIRKDGVLQELGTLENRVASPLISRIKVLARMDISEKRLPQDGRLQARIDGRQVDMRVSTLPTVFGETAVLRILDKTQVGLDLDNVGMPDREKLMFKRAISRPYGMVLVAGPTGSGKTTTLYSAVREIHTPGLKFMTIEDPVEYQMMDVVQVPVSDRQGLTFAAGLRAIVRQDPNKVLVGEVRDLDTAKIAVAAALTGHLVLTTIHANDALEALLRLTGLGIAPRDFASSLNLILSQRLMRRLCTACRVPRTEIPAALRDVIEDLERYKDVDSFVSTGCAVCHRTGYSGRTGIYEVLALDDDLRELIVAGASPVKLRHEARSRGLVTLREAAWELVRRGDTNLEELVRVTIAG